jgi:regulation of enolase protein 1 (concanavalin A-like superfamily)
LSCPSLSCPSCEASDGEIRNPKSEIPGWSFVDPLGDCACTVGEGLEIRAANQRDLRRPNLSAPRLVRPVAGEFALEAGCCPADARRPALGGLLIWKDAGNFLRLDRGTRGETEISFAGCIAGHDHLIGRGHLPPSERVFLRLERRAGRVRALCSADGQRWFTVGEAPFAPEDPVEVGVHAIGVIERYFYPGAHPEGTAIRFETLHLCQPAPTRGRA